MKGIFICLLVGVLIVFFTEETLKAQDNSSSAISKVNSQ